jgi:hypothetical protein
MPPPPPPPDTANQTGTITGTVRLRERENGDESLLVSVGGEATDPIEFVQLTLPQKFTWKPALLPEGWTFKADGKRLELKRLELKGPPMPTPRLFFRFDAVPGAGAVKELPRKRCQFRARVRARDFEWQAVIGLEPRVKLSATLDGALNLPPLTSEGEPFVGTIPHSHGPTKGTWTLRIRDTGMTAIDAAPPEDVYRNIGGLTGTFKPFFGRVHPDLRFTFVDHYGEKLIDAPGDWRLMPQAPSCVTSMTGGSTMAFAGKPACVSGCFTDLGGPARFKLDGTEDLAILAASTQSVVVAIPDNTPPGSRWIGFDSAGGSKASSRHVLQIVQLRGTIADADLFTGQATTMRLDIVGTDKKLPLIVWNRDPWVIDLEGGVRQTVETSGGAANSATRSVTGIMRGDFAIDYSLNLPQCGLPQ